MLIDINKIVVGERIRKDFGDIQELADDINENGLINPPVVNKSYELLAGERRLRACKSLGWPTIEVRMMDTRDAEHELNIEISENDVRKGFTKSERLDYIRRLLRIEQAKGRENMSLGGKGKGSEISRNLDSDESTAAAFGISSNTMRREIYISDNQDLLDPSDFADWDEGKLSTNKAYQKIKAAQAQAERERKLAEQERDNARKELADAYHQSSLMETEVASLRKQLAEKPKPEVIERKVVQEVAPKDYDSIRHERDVYLGDIKKLREKNESLRKELDKAKDLLGMDKNMQDIRKDVQYLINATNQYVRHYGGLTWTAASLEQVDAQTISDFRKAVTNLATFASALVASLEEFDG